MPLRNCQILQLPPHLRNLFLRIPPELMLLTFEGRGKREYSLYSSSWVTSSQVHLVWRFRRGPESLLLRICREMTRRISR
jgi:hypothetical protein